MKNGHFIISLDFELHWGIFDLMGPKKYEENLKNVPIAIDRLLELSDKYNVKLTFATVGFLFAKNKAELLKFSPNLEPSYSNKKLNAYSIFDEIGDNENNDPYHYAYSSLNKIKNNSNHEIGTHTFCHYYTNEKGQTVNQFNEDLVSVKNIAEQNNLDIKSIVFPRNQVNQSYLNCCEKHGISSYRGTEKSYIYSIPPSSKYYSSPVIRALRLIDSYVNLTGYNTYDVKKINQNKSQINLPSSRFLRPYNKVLNLFESLKIRRIKKGMKYAAKHNQVFHLWWHPHNFGKNIEQNFENLESIFIAYEKLANKFDFESTTMSKLTAKLTK